MLLRATEPRRPARRHVSGDPEFIPTPRLVGEWHYLMAGNCRRCHEPVRAFAGVWWESDTRRHFCRPGLWMTEGAA